MNAPTPRDKSPRDESLRDVFNTVHYAKQGTTRAVFVQVGNSDDKLTQLEWSNLLNTVRTVLVGHVVDAGGRVHGDWYSSSDSRYQNACWLVELPRVALAPVRAHLATIAREFHQDSIAWTEGITEFIAPAPALSAEPELSGYFELDKQVRYYVMHEHTSGNGEKHGHSTLYHHPDLDADDHTDVEVLDTWAEAQVAWNID